mmetsp:Transcript_5255/g.12654  ORF Transcript_5255/g.12654 Transcript_5255/m.12654 type:complete len:155 (+) Transcript_5255:716-1180(+)
MDPALDGGPDGGPACGGGGVDRRVHFPETGSPRVPPAGDQLDCGWTVSTTTEVLTVCGRGADGKRPGASANTAAILAACIAAISFACCSPSAGPAVFAERRVAANPGTKFVGVTVANAPIPCPEVADAVPAWWFPGMRLWAGDTVEGDARLLGV